MCKIKSLFLLALVAVLCFSCKGNTEDERAMQQMVERLFPRYASQFSFEQSKEIDKDWYEIESKEGMIWIRGNNANSMAVGLNHYLNHYCLTSVSWYANDAVEMPDVLPMLSTKITSTARCKNRFFLNYCTFGYTMPWWTWKDWERLIDWMALNGINMPLAITGQESVWYRVWTKLGLTDDEIRNYFTGPAHLPWHRMSNLDYWQGPLPKKWLDTQEALQKQIVARERQFNMRPILPAFAGHVPSELKRIYPEAKISRMSSWGGFEDKYRSHFLDPLDPLFATVQKEFLEEQTKLFGTDHIYGADPFNEVSPPSWEPEFLSNCSKNIYQSMTRVDPDATWLQMTWLFYYDRHLWTNERVEAFLKAVPQDKMLLLDYYCERTEVWKQTDRYFGQPYLWCYLGNFGGNTMMQGNTEEVGKRIENVYVNGGENFWGLGSTLEGFDVNPFMYEYVFSKAWDNNPSDTVWMNQLADRRIGLENRQMRRAWKLLYDSVYVVPSGLGGGTLMNARPRLKGAGHWTNHAIAYSNEMLFEVWETLLKAGQHQRATYEYDVVNTGRQVLGNYFRELRDEFAEAYSLKQLPLLKQKGAEMKQLLHEVDTLLSTQSSFLVGKWIGDARSLGTDEAAKNYYEENARTIITTWGDKAQSLNDYANRTWGGLVSGYYAPRWEMFIDEIIHSVSNGKPFDADAFHQKVTQFEIDWVKSHERYPSEPAGNPVEIATLLMNKYKDSIVKEKQNENDFK